MRTPYARWRKISCPACQVPIMDRCTTEDGEPHMERRRVAAQLYLNDLGIRLDALPVAG